MMKLWVKVGQSESTKVDYRDGEDVDDLKKTIKTAMSPVFNEVAVADIIIRRQQGVEFLAPGVLLKDILAAGHGNTAEQPILVDAPAPAGKNVIKALPWLSTALATLVPIPFSQQFIDTILSHPVAHILSTLAEFYTTQRLGAAVPAAAPAAAPTVGQTSKLVDDFSAVWTALVQGTIIEDTMNPRVWMLPGEIPWIGTVKRFYNRECYDTITQDIFGNKLTHALIIGTPGIGKTMYLQCILVRLARLARSGRRDPPSIHYQRRYAGAVQTLSFLPNGSVEDVTGVKHNIDPDYLLSDSVDLDPPYGKVLNLEVASDKPTNYNNFQKRIGEPGDGKKGEEMVMPLFSFEELLCIKPTTVGNKAALFLYDIFGGSARNFLCTSNLKSAILPVVEDTMGLMFPDIAADSSLSDLFAKVARNVSAKLLTDSMQDPSGPSTINSMMRHRLPERTMIWASRFMEFLAAAIVDDKASDIIGALKQIIGASGIGCLFEALGHRKLLTSSLEFLLKPLLLSIPSERPTFEEASFSLPVVRFRAIAEMRNLPNGTYGLPMNGNFPFLDGVVQPDTFIQYTVSLNHKGAVDQLDTMREQLREKDRSKHRVVFVVPHNNVRTFKFQSNLATISQFICIDDPSAIDEESLMTEAEKKKWIGQASKRRKHEPQSESTA